MTCSKRAGGHRGSVRSEIRADRQPAAARRHARDRAGREACRPGCDRAGLTDCRGASRRTGRCGASSGRRVIAGVVPARAGALSHGENSRRPRRSSAPRCAPHRTSCRGCSISARAIAAGGNARQAAGAWQTALIADDPPPEVYQLVAESYLRLGDGDEAANLLQEAGSRWPDDPRFAITSALARAANGHVTEALAGLKPVLDGPAPGSQALGLAVRLAAANMATADDHAARRPHFVRSPPSCRLREPTCLRWPCGGSRIWTNGRFGGSEGRGVLAVTGARGRQRRARRATRRGSPPP
jgi:hypothetical protein